MLFAVTLTYLKHDVISAHLDDHKRWLVRGLSEGRIIFAGPLSNGTGGYILFHGDNVSDVHSFLNDDPFTIYSIADADVVSVEPALCAQEFSTRWADKARFM